MAFIFRPGALRELFGPELNAIDTLPVDVTVRETHTFNTSVTTKPVEDGTVVATNQILQPVEVSISGILNDDRTGATSWEDKFAVLTEIRRKREPFTLVTSLAVYEDMAITNLTVNRDLTTAGALFFDASLIKINIISSRTTQIPQTAVTDAPGGAKAKAPKQDSGKKQPQTSDAETEQKQERSILATIIF